MFSSKIKKQLKEYTQFKNNFKFELKPIKEDEKGVYFDGECIKNKLTNEKFDLFENKFVNVRFNSKQPLSKCLSNLFAYEFVFKGKKVSSIEAVFQGLKFKDKKMQNLVLKYSGIESNYIKIANNYNWKQTGVLYWQGKQLVRDSKEYEHFINELYISALANPLYKNLLKNIGDLYILHSMGAENKNETVYTRAEFEKQLNCIKEFVKSN